MTVGQTSGVLNVVSGQSRSFVDALQIVTGLVGSPPEVSSRARSKAKVDHGFDTARLCAAVPGFTFTTLEEGLRRTLAAERLPTKAGA